MSIKRLVGFWISLLGAAALGGPQAGCESNVDEQLKLAVLGQDCLVNSDCKDPFLCAFELCHSACEESRDCPPGARCVGAARPYKVCQLEEERRCQRTRDCPDGLVCGVDSECRDSCENDAQCVSGQSCVSGTCADADELDEDGQLPVASSQAGRTEGAPCTYVSDCEGVLLCREQVCLPECRADKDCPTGKTCQDTRCTPDGSQPKACSYHSQCVDEPGKHCLGGHCLRECVEDRDCAAGKTCADGDCVPAPDSCRINSDCTTPGHVCRDQRCDWECKKDVDCGAGRRCNGGGCVDALDPIDDIVVGSVQIGSTLQLERYRGVVEIQGDLTFSAVLFENLDGALDDLEQVSGRITVSDNTLHSLSLPKLRHTQAITVLREPMLTEIDLRALEHAELTISDAPQLGTLDLSALQTSPSISIVAASLLTAIDLPSLTDTVELELMRLHSLTSVRCKSLTSVGKRLVLDESGKDVPITLDLSKLASVGTKVGEVFEGTIELTASRIATLDGFGSASFQALVPSIYVQLNAPLTDCDAEASITRWTSEAFTGGHFDQNVPCPSGSAGAPAQ